MAKFKANGDLEWEKDYGGPGNEYSGISSIVLTSDNGYAIVGTAEEANEQIYLVKTKANGDLDWGKSYGETIASLGYSVIQTSDGGYAIAGIIAPGVIPDQVYLIKLKGPPPPQAPDHKPNPGTTYLDRHLDFGNCVNVYIILRDLNNTMADNCFTLTITDTDNQIIYTRNCTIRPSTNWYVFILCKDRFTPGTYNVHATACNWSQEKQFTTN